MEEGRLGADGGDVPMAAGVEDGLWAFVLVGRVQPTTFDRDTVVATCQGNWIAQISLAAELRCWTESIERP